MPKSKSQKLGRPEIPVTLYNQETGKKKTWKSAAQASEELGVSRWCIYNTITGNQKTTAEIWAATPPKIHRKRGRSGPREIKENFQTINHDLLEKWRALAPSIVELQKLGGNLTCQFIREIQDADVAECVGVQEINVNNHGADGRKDGVILFEHKNQSNENLDVTFQDFSLPRVQTFCNGVLTVGTKWEGFLQKKYSVIFNSKNVGELILDGQKNYRKSVTIPLNTLLENGAKVIAWDNDLTGALKDIKSLHPNTKLTLTDIYGADDAKYVADMVMETAEDALW